MPYAGHDFEHARALLEHLLLEGAKNGSVVRIMASTVPGLLTLQAIEATAERRLTVICRHSSTLMTHRFALVGGIKPSMLGSRDGYVARDEEGRDLVIFVRENAPARPTESESSVDA